MVPGEQRHRPGSGVFRAREEVGSRALARARDLELLTARMSEELNAPLGEVRRRVDRAAETSSDAEAREPLGLVSSEISRDLHGHRDQRVDDSGLDLRAVRDAGRRTRRASALG